MFQVASSPATDSIGLVAGFVSCVIFGTTVCSEGGVVGTFHGPINGSVTGPVAVVGGRAGPVSHCVIVISLKRFVCLQVGHELIESPSLQIEFWPVAHGSVERLLVVCASQVWKSALHSVAIVG